MFSRCTGSMQREQRMCASNFGGRRCWGSSASCRAAWSGWRHVRPTMRFVPVKTADQQAAVLLHRGRERLVRQRTMLVNALRAHLAEFGVIAPQGLRNVGKLIAIIRDDEDARLPDLARQVL